MQLVNQVNKEELDFRQMTNIISRDLSLTYNLLKLVNSAAFGFRYKINTVKHGLVALGEREIRKWIHLIVLNDMGNGRPDELTRLSLIRARFLELIAMETRYKSKSEDIFLLGLFSLLDVILNRSLEEVLNEIKATDIIKDVLLNESGELDELYRMTLYYEKGEWDKVLIYANHLNIDSNLIILSYMNALIWYNMLVQE